MTPPMIPRQASSDDAPAVAALLHDFNLEFGEPSPGPSILSDRLGRLLAGNMTFALLAGEPAVGVALVTLRPNVWYDAPVALLDELYVVPARRRQGIGSALLKASCELARSLGVQLMEINVDGEDRDARGFYERHGFSCMHGQSPQPELYYSRELNSL